MSLSKIRKTMTYGTDQYEVNGKSYWNLEDALLSCGNIISVFVDKYENGKAVEWYVIAESTD
jgi:hypothetical protein